MGLIFNYMYYIHVCRGYSNHSCSTARDSANTAPDNAITVVIMHPTVLFGSVGVSEVSFYCRMYTCVHEAVCLLLSTGKGRRHGVFVQVHQ